MLRKIHFMALFLVAIESIHYLHISFYSIAKLKLVLTEICVVNSVERKTHDT